VERDWGGDKGEERVIGGLEEADSGREGSGEDGNLQGVGGRELLGEGGEKGVEEEVKGRCRRREARGKIKC
jgi:hypothetical protein